MIRINLAVERPRPKVKRRVAVPGGVFLIYLLVAAGLGGAALAADYYFWIRPESQRLDREISALTARKTDLAQFEPRLAEVKANQEKLENQKRVIDDLNANRAGPVRLLEAIGTTVSLTETLWLNSMTQKSSDEIEFVGQAASVDAVANFITSLNNSGFFQNVEIKETSQKGGKQGPASFAFTLTAKFAFSGAKPGGESKGAPARGGGG